MMWNRERGHRFLALSNGLVAVVIEGAAGMSAEELDAMWAEWAQMAQELRVGVRIMRTSLATRAARAKVIPFPSGGRRDRRLW